MKTNQNVLPLSDKLSTNRIHSKLLLGRLLRGYPHQAVKYRKAENSIKSDPPLPDTCSEELVHHLLAAFFFKPLITCFLNRLESIDGEKNLHITAGQKSKEIHTLWHFSSLTGCLAGGLGPLYTGMNPLSLEKVI